MVQSNGATITESLKINSNNLLGFYEAKSLGPNFVSHAIVSLVKAATISAPLLCSVDGARSTMTIE